MTIPIRAGVRETMAPRIGIRAEEGQGRGCVSCGLREAGASSAALAKSARAEVERKCVFPGGWLGI